jgi:Rod binding domain-containing protein
MNSVDVSSAGSLELPTPREVSPRRLAPARDLPEEFETLFLTQILNAMQETVEKSGLLDGGSAEETYREMLNQAVSREIARRGGLGLAEQIAHQIENYRAAFRHDQAAGEAFGAGRSSADE